MAYFIEAKLGNMRKAQEFIVYPFAEGEVEFKIQSDQRIARINIETGKGVLSKGRSNGAYGIDLMPIRGAMEIDVPAEIAEKLKGLAPTGKQVQITGAGNIFESKVVV